MTELILSFLDAQLDLGFGKPILWREIVGNVFGLASMLFGMRRKVWAWPVGIGGNLLLFTVFLGGVFHTPQNLDLWGQALRQIFFLMVSTYGWIVWGRNKKQIRTETGSGEAVIPRWATWPERIGLLLVAAAMWVVFHFVLQWLGSWGPAADAWILTGSILAQLGMARGWIDFWFIWIAVDLVGVPLLLSAHLYPSAIMYGAYLVLCVWGMVTWLRHRQSETDQTPVESSLG